MDEFNNGFDQQQQAPMTSFGTDPNTAVMSMKDWLITLLIFCVPCVNIVMMFVWAFGTGNENRKNYCRAALIFAAISVVLSFLFSSALIGMIASMAPRY